MLTFVLLHSHRSGGKYWQSNRCVQTIMSTMDGEQLSVVWRTTANRTHDNEVMVH